MKCKALYASNCCSPCLLFQFLALLLACIQYLQREQENTNHKIAPKLTIETKGSLILIIPRQRRQKLDTRKISEYKREKLPASVPGQIKQYSSEKDVVSTRNN